MDAAALAREAVAFFEASIEKKRMRLDVEVADGLPKVLADPDKSRKCSTTCCPTRSNLRPMGEGFALQLEDLSPRPFVQISVIDSGLGIRPEDQAKIFNKFEQVKSTRQKIRGPKGTGLGLAICRSLIELHGGELRVRSQEEEGSTFSFTLPVAPAAVAAFALT